MSSNRLAFSWSAFRSQKLAEDGQLFGFTLQSDKYKSWWDGNYDRSMWNVGFTLLKIMAPDSHNWELSHDGFRWSYLMNKFMSSVSGMSKKEVILCAFYPVRLWGANLKFFNWHMPDNCFLACPLRPWKDCGTVDPWFQQLYENSRPMIISVDADTESGSVRMSTLVPHSTYNLNYVIADLLFVESNHKLDLSRDINVTLNHIQGNFDAYDYCLLSKDDYRLSLDTAILIGSSKMKRYLYAVPWKIEQREFENRRDVKLYLRKLFKWFDNRRSDQSDSTPCPGVLFFEPNVSYKVELEYEELPDDDMSLVLYCLGSDCFGAPF